MTTSVRVVDFLLREAARRAGEDLSTLDRFALEAWRELQAPGVSKGASLDAIEPYCDDFIATLVSNPNADLERDLTKARLRASASQLQSAETIVLAIGSMAAILILVLRFSEIERDGERFVIRAKDNSFNSKHIESMFKLIQKIIPFLGAAKSPADHPVDES